MRKKFRIPIYLFLLSFSSSLLAQTEKPLKLSPLSTAQTVIVNAITDMAFFLMKPPKIEEDIDKGSTVYSYFAKPTYQLGLPGEHFATMVTPEGRLYTGYAELMFFAKDLKPISQRIYTLLDGWIPCIQYQVFDRGLIYKVEAFQYWLEPDQRKIPVNFIRFSVKNPGSENVQAGMAVGYKFGESDHRPPKMKQGKFNPFWTYSFSDNYALRNKKLIYYFDQKPTRKWSIDVAGEAKGKFWVLENWRQSSMVEYEFDLSPQEERSFIFKFPHYPQAIEPEIISKISQADYEQFKTQLVNFWTEQINRGMTISLSEPKALNASRAAMVHNIMSQEYPTENEIKQTVNRFQYNAFWLRDSAFHARMYAIWGRLDDSKKLLRYFLRYQDKSGNFISQKGQLDGFGQALWAFGEYLKISDDKEFAKEILPAVERAVVWFQKTTSEDEYGLMPKTSAMDNEWIIGRYTGHNIWALAGLDGAIYVAKTAGDEKLREEFQGLRDKFAENLYRRIGEASARNNGIIPPGLDVPLGVDWGNLFEVYPMNFIPPDHPLIVKTFDHYRKKHMKEGIATYRTSLHHYVTERVTEMAVIQGKQELALSDFYSMLAHTGSCHQGFEWTIFPGTDRDYCTETPLGQHCNFPPHGWFAALYNTLLRNMLIREYENELHIFSVLSPQWIRPGDEIIINNAPTYFGKISLKAVSQNDGLYISISAQFKNTPEKIIIHCPSSHKLAQVVFNGREIKIKDPHNLVFSPAT